VDPATRIVVLHADRSAQTHPLRERQRELVAALPDATLDVWYEEGSAGAHQGFLQLDVVDLPDGAEVYLCGADGFVRVVRDQLVARGVQRVHCELFSPNDWLL
jgi:nitric oxide dioxygenase